MLHPAQSPTQIDYIIVSNGLCFDARVHHDVVFRSDHSAILASVSCLDSSSCAGGVIDSLASFRLAGCGPVLSMQRGVGRRGCAGGRGGPVRH